MFDAKCGREVAWLDRRESNNHVAAFTGLQQPAIRADSEHLVALQAAKECLLAATHHVQAFELMAEELRRAQVELARITGEVTADDLLGQIFSRFCIGK